jgi:FHA domain
MTIIQTIADSLTSFGPDVAFALDLGTSLEAARELATQAWGNSYVWALENYGRTPALMVGLAALLLLPPLALASGLISRLTLPRQSAPSRSRDTREEGQLNAMIAATLQSSATQIDAPDHPANMAWPREAWLTAERQSHLRYNMPRELLSIGRGEDNDLVLDEATVHRYHAIIQRTPEALFLIKDLGGPGGNGVFVNDERVTEAHLLDADRISLGAATLVFHARRVGDHNVSMKS